jgi:hypothetical protein
MVVSYYWPGSIAAVIVLLFQLSRWITFFVSTNEG